MKVEAEDVAAVSKERHEVGETSNGVDIFAFVVGIGLVNIVTLSMAIRRFDIFAVLVIVGRVDVLHHSLPSNGLFAGFVEVGLVCHAPARVSSLFGIIGVTITLSPHSFSSDGPASSQYSLTEGSASTRYSISDRFKNSSSSDESTSTHYASASAESLSSPTVLYGSVPLHHPPLEVSMSVHHPSQTETPPNKGNFSTGT